MTSKILHIISDELFADYAIEQFFPLPIHSDFVWISSNNKGEELVHNMDKIRIIRPNSAEFEKLLLQLSDYSGVIFHGIFGESWPEKIFHSLHQHIKVAWVFLGGEIYDRPECSLDPLNVWTRRVCAMRSFIKYRFKYRQPQSLQFLPPLDLFQRIDYCLTDVKEEFEYAKNFLKHSRLQYLFYSYYSLEDTVGSLMSKRANGINIWLGNSAALANNYFDVLLTIWHNRRNIPQKTHIIIPLSYGTLWARNTIVKLGKWLFGSNFCPLIRFLPRDEYNAKFLSCSTMIMAHIRPHAQGNIITGLWLGLRVYLSEKSMTYHYFKRLGCIVYSLEHDFNKNNPNLLKPMTEEELRHNRKILYNIYSRTSTQKAVLNIVNALIK